MKSQKAPIYARFAEVTPDGKGRVWDGRRWIGIDPREIIQATKRAVIEEAHRPK